MSRLSTLLLALALALGASSLAGCATTRVCNRSAANELGRSDARRWDASRSNLRQGRTCKEEYTRDDFTADYRAGFKQALGAQCRVDAAAAAGAQAAAASAEWQLDSGALELCAEVGAPVAELRQAYEQAYTGTWCSAAHAEQRAQQDGERLQPVALDWLAGCPGERQEALVRSYTAQHAQAIAAACSAPAMASWGVTLAREDGDLARALAAVSACPPAQQREAVAALQRSYDGELQRLALLREEQRRQQAAEERAREHAAREEQRRVAASRREFVIAGKRVTLTCSVDDGRARVELFNHDRAHLSASGYLTVESYDASGRPIDASRTSALFSASPGGLDDESVRVPRQAVSCLVSEVEFH